MANEEEILLAFKESGVEFVEEASNAVGELGESFKGVEQAAQEAIEALTEEGTVLDDLRQKIVNQKTELEALADAHLAGIINQSKYKEKTDELLASLSENETVLKRLTAAETEQAEAEAKLLKEQEAAAAALEKTARAAGEAAARAEARARREAEAEEESLRRKVAAAEKAEAADREREAKAEARHIREAAAEEASLQRKVAAAERAEAGAEALFLREAAAEEASFARRVAAAERAAAKRIAAEEAAAEAAEAANARIVSSIMAAEKVAAGLASGSGFARMGGMLEKITGAIGLAGGTGMAAGGLIFAIEALWPKIDKLIEKMDGAADATERAAARLKAADEQMKKLRAQPEEEEEESAKGIKAILAGRRGMLTASGIEQALREEGYGLSDEQKRILATPGVSKYEKDIIREGQAESIRIRRGRMIAEAEAGRGPTISEIGGMAGRHPNLFPAETEDLFLQNLPDARARAKEEDRKLDEEEAERQGRKTARFEKAKELNKQDKERAVAAKDHIGDLKTELSDLGLDLREKKITPQEYQAKAGELVDAIAKAVQDLAKIPGEEVKAARRDIDAAKRQVRTTFDAGVTAMHRAADKAAHDAKTAADKAHRDAERRARENTPEHRLHEQIAADRNVEAGTAHLLDQMNQERGGPAATPEFLQGVVSAAARQRAMTGRSAAQSVLDVLGIALDQYDMQWNAEFARGLNSVMRGAGQQNRPQQNVVPFGGI